MCLMHGRIELRRQTRMQKWARPNIRYAIATVRQNGQWTRRMQKWVRPNIPRPKSHSSSSLRRSTSPDTSQRRERTRSSRSASTEDTKRECRDSSRQKKRLPKKKEEETSTSGTSSSEDKDEVHDKPKHTLKPPKFDGQGSFETFMAQFLNCAKHNKWTRADKLAYLRNSLDKEAANILWDYGKDVTESLSGLTRILESRFGGQDVSDKHRIELRNRRRRKNETLQSLHSDVRRLTSRSISSPVTYFF